jgi:hypothetical protein
MAATTITTGTLDATPDWARKYPPLLALVVAGVIALAVLPSSFTLPQSNPTQTQEYAPVPPDDQNDAPPQGNLSSLGLGSSEGVKGGGAGGGGEGGGPGDTGVAVPAPPVVKGVNPSTKHCVGNPPRQTEDPLAPPCVPFFNGDNGGATYQGVTADEVRLLVYIDGGINYINGSTPGDNVAPSGVYYDLFQPPKEGETEHLIVRGFRGWQRYFNERFQTYNRRVHFFVYFSDGSGDRTPEARRADAADNFQQVKPFAVLSFATEGNEDAYLQQMARKAVLNFGSFALKPQSFYQQFPKLIWSYLPSVEQQAEQYVSYICTKVVGKESVLAGADLNHRPRKIGMVFTTDKKQAGLRLMADTVKRRVAECGGSIEAEAPFPECCLAQDNGDTGTYGQEEMADFKTKGITTILWPGGINGNMGKSAAAIQYYPEWVVLGDGTMEASRPTNLSQNSPSFDGHAVVVTPQTYQPAFEQQRCYQAYKEADTTLADTDLTYVCEFYRNLFQIFTGIQVAGPRLGPTSIDKGFHAIPAVESTDVQTPACFYKPGDYTCVKDAIHEIWRAGQNPPGNNQPGCWASIENAKRYLPGRWPDGNVDAQITGNEPCNAYDASVRFNLA